MAGRGGAIGAPSVTATMTGSTGAGFQVSLSGLVPPWPEWSDVELSMEKWDVSMPAGKTTGAPAKDKAPVKGGTTTGGTAGGMTPLSAVSLFEDPVGVKLPASLMGDGEVTWKRPSEFFQDDTSPLCVVDESASDNPVDLYSTNMHLLKSEIMRNILSDLMVLSNLMAQAGRLLASPGNGSRRPSLDSSLQSQQQQQDAPPDASLVYPEDPWRPWHHVYSMCRSGKGIEHKPLYNAAGKYIIRIFFMGCWRRVIVDDLMPYDQDDQILLPWTGKKHELWCPLLVKGLLKVAELSWDDVREVVHFSATACLTGGIVQPVHFPKDMTKKEDQLWDVSKRVAVKYEWPPAPCTEDDEWADGDGNKRPSGLPGLTQSAMVAKGGGGKKPSLPGSKVVDNQSLMSKNKGDKGSTAKKSTLPPTGGKDKGGPGTFGATGMPSFPLSKYQDNEPDMAKLMCLPGAVLLLGLSQKEETEEDALKIANLQFLNGETQVIVSQYRDITLARPAPKPRTPLWKTFRWTSWAQRQGIIPVPEKEPIRTLKVHIPVVERVINPPPDQPPEPPAPPELLTDVSPPPEPEGLPTVPSTAKGKKQSTRGATRAPSSLGAGRGGKGGGASISAGARKKSGGPRKMSGTTAGSGSGGSVEEEPAMHPFFGMAEPVWVTVEELAPRVKWAHVLRHPQPLSYNCWLSNCFSSGSSPAGGKGAKEKELPPWVSRCPPVRRSPGTDSGYYLFVDSLLEKEVTAQITSLGPWVTPTHPPPDMEDDPEMITMTSTAHIMMEPFQWDRYHQYHEPIACVRTKATRAATIFLPPGRQVFRIWIKSPGMFTVLLTSLAPIRVVTKDVLWDLMAIPSSLLLAAADELSLTIRKMMTSVGTPDKYNHYRSHLRKVLCITCPATDKNQGLKEKMQKHLENMFLEVLKSIPKFKTSPDTVFALRILFCNHQMGSGMKWILQVLDDGKDKKEKKGKAAPGSSPQAPEKEGKQKKGAESTVNTRKSSHIGGSSTSPGQRASVEHLPTVSPKAFMLNNVDPEKAHKAACRLQSLALRVIAGNLLAGHRMGSRGHERASVELARIANALEEWEAGESSADPSGRWSVRIMRSYMQEFPNVVEHYPFFQDMPKMVLIQQTSAKVPSAIPGSWTPFTRLSFFVSKAPCGLYAIEVSCSQPTCVIRVLDNDDNGATEATRFQGTVTPCVYKQNRTGHSILCYRWDSPQVPSAPATGPDANWVLRILRGATTKEVTWGDNKIPMAGGVASSHLSLREVVTPYLGVGEAGNNLLGGCILTATSSKDVLATIHLRASYPMAKLRLEVVRVTVVEDGGELPKIESQTIMEEYDDFDVDEGDDDGGGKGPGGKGKKKGNKPPTGGGGGNKGIKGSGNTTPQQQSQVKVEDQESMVSAATAGSTSSEVGELLFTTTGTGGIFIPIMILSPVQHGYYLLQVLLSKDSWPLTPIEWQCVTQQQEKIKQELLASWTSFSSTSSKKLRKSQQMTSKESKNVKVTVAQQATKTRKGDKVSSDDMIDHAREENTLPDEAPNWILQVLADAESGIELTKDTRRADAIRTEKRGWFQPSARRSASSAASAEGEPNVNRYQEAQEMRSAFLSEFMEQPVERTDSDISIAESTISSASTRASSRRKSSGSNAGSISPSQGSAGKTSKSSRTTTTSQPSPSSQPSQPSSSQQRVRTLSTVSIDASQMPAVRTCVNPFSKAKNIPLKDEGMYAHQLAAPGQQPAQKALNLPVTRSPTEQPSESSEDSEEIQPPVSAASLAAKELHDERLQRGALFTLRSRRLAAVMAHEQAMRNAARQEYRESLNNYLEMKRQAKEDEERKMKAEAIARENSLKEKKKKENEEEDEEEQENKAPVGGKKKKK